MARTRCFGRVVDTIRTDKVLDRSRGTELDRVICTLWCGASHPAGDMRQPSVKCNQSTLLTPEHAMRALRQKIVDKHAGCLHAAETARAAAGGPSSRPPPNAMAALMAARAAQVAADRAEAALRAAELRRAEARQMLEAAEREANALTAAAIAADSALPEAKRRRTHAPAAPWEAATEGWDIQGWRDFEKREQKRRAVEVGTAPDAPDPQRESDCAVRGEERTASTYQPAACGHCHMLLASCCVLCGTDEYIVQSMATALNKVSVSVEQRHAYFTVLTAMEPRAPAPDAEQRRMQRVVTRLGVVRALLHARLPMPDSSGYIFSEANSEAGSEEPL